MRYSPYNNSTDNNQIKSLSMAHKNHKRRDQKCLDKLELENWLKDRQQQEKEMYKLI
jgi:hypothetical protein